MKPNNYNSVRVKSQLIENNYYLKCYFNKFISLQKKKNERQLNNLNYRTVFLREKCLLLNNKKTFIV